MPAVPHGHRQFQLFVLDLPRIKTWLRRQDVIDRRKLESAASSQEDAEILGVPVLCPNSLKQNLRFRKRFLVFGWCVARFQQV
jgi:hypothetical protein